MRPLKFGLISILICSVCWGELNTNSAVQALQPRTIALGVTQNRPFEAEFTRTYTVKSPDGTVQAKTTTGVLARDHEGRVRIESCQRATIYDPAGRRMILLDLVSRTVIVTGLMDVAMDLRSGWVFSGLKPVNGYRGEADEVAGIACRRLRFELTDGPAGGFADVWVSDDLHQLMRERISSAHEEFNWTISRIQQVEPDSRLFRAPKGFARTD